MGAQQSKSDDELLNRSDMEGSLNDYIQQNNSNKEREHAVEQQQHDENQLMNEFEETVIPDQYHTLLPITELNSEAMNSTNQIGVTLADFAKIKTEPSGEVPVEISKPISDVESIEIKRELLQIPNRQETISDLETVNQEQQCALVVQISKPTLEQPSIETTNITQEQLDGNFHSELSINEYQHHPEDDSNFLQNSSLDNTKNSLEICRDIETEILENAHGLNNLYELDYSYPDSINITESYIAGECCVMYEIPNEDPLNIKQNVKAIKNESLEEIPAAENQELSKNFVKSELIEGVTIPFNIHLNTTNNEIEPFPNNDDLTNNNNLLHENLCVAPPLNIDLPSAQIKQELVENLVDENLYIKVKDPDKDESSKNNLIKDSILNENSKNVFLPNIDELPEENPNIHIENNIDEITNDNEECFNKEAYLKCDLVRNPFAFLKSLYKKKAQAEKIVSVNTAIKSEIIDDSENVCFINGTSTPIIKIELSEIIDNNTVGIRTETGSILKDGKQNVSLQAAKVKHTQIISKEKDISFQTINTNELIIKSETLDDFFSLDSNLHSTNNSIWNTDSIIPQDEEIVDSLENYQLPFHDVIEHLNESLEVNVDNLSTPDSHIDETFLTQQSDDLLSNSTAITSPTTTSADYRSIIEISSLDDFDTLIIKANEENRKRVGRPKGNKNQKERSLSKSSQEKPQKIKRKYSPKFVKYSKQNIKDLPKIHIKRRSQNPSTTPSENCKKKSLKQDDFPKPFKLEMDTDNTTDLPKPIVFKCETSKRINVNDTELYKIPELQPSVRLKRLKSDDLLVPLKIRKFTQRRNNCKRTTRASLSKTYPPVNKSSTTHNFYAAHSRLNMGQRNILIQNAYSLNPRVKLHRWSMDHEYPYDNYQNNNHSSSSYGMQPDNDSINESKYFTSQELFSIFKSNTPEGSSSMLSGNYDSGIPSSTPPNSRSSSNRETDNKTILLEIAAERAFINNHLQHFGFSPIKFELYNDVDDLNVFLKYLFGQSRV